MANNTWQKAGETLSKDFEFVDFAAALAFVNSVGSLAEQLNHHPDILLHNYRRVRVSTSTHEAGGVTEKDYELARAIDDSALNKNAS